MTTKRLAILLAVLVVGLGSIFLLPQQLGFQPVGIELNLPDHLAGGWYGKELQVSEKERSVLKHDMLRRGFDRHLPASGGTPKAAAFPRAVG